MKNLLLTIMLIAPFTLSAQFDAMNDKTLSTDQKDAMKVVLELFEAYRNGDAAGVAATFTDDAQLQRVTQKDGKTEITAPGSTQGFVDYVAKNGKSKKHDEPVWDYEISAGGNLASIWVKYAFYLDGEFHHCGVENFLLVKTDRWRIFHLVDTSQNEGCEVPREVVEGEGRL